ncbi:unnamed protein product [Adineta steineri]|uniref:GCVT N-terminal domain-containing protein n=1 Tax=Adineta steineri TaxID=433720 RepID=A0A819KRP2_9BILA|nr:unnamed protein product [Adineta steineri]
MNLTFVVDKGYWDLNLNSHVSLHLEADITPDVGYVVQNNIEHKNFEDLSKQGTFGKARWFNIVKKEYNACRKGVAIIDMTSFTKYELKSANRNIVDFLQMLCANNIDMPIGTVVHTGMSNEHNGYENDCSVIRLGEYHFLLVSSTSQSTRNIKWLKAHVPEDNSIFLLAVTSLYTALNLIGPNAKYLLFELSDENFNDFARMTCQV